MLSPIKSYLKHAVNKVKHNHGLIIFLSSVDFSACISESISLCDNVPIKTDLLKLLLSPLCCFYIHVYNKDSAGGRRCWSLGLL